MLEDANGWLPSETELSGIDGPEGVNRRQENPLGTTMYFSIEQTRHTGTDQPLYPDKDIWWYNPETLETHRWLPDDIGGGQWIPVSDQDRTDSWYGSRPDNDLYYLPGEVNMNYLAYSNKDGSVFGLFKLI